MRGLFPGGVTCAADHHIGHSPAASNTLENEKRVLFQSHHSYQLAISSKVTCRVMSDGGQKGESALVNKIH